MPFVHISRGFPALDPVRPTFFRLKALLLLLPDPSVQIITATSSFELKYINSDVDNALGVPGRVLPKNPTGQALNWSNT